jgi:4-hydroxy-tetrahydrodipicolinate synthase
MKKMTKYSGTGVAMVTPFLENKSVDYNGLKDLINHCIQGGVEFLVSLGTTGESATLLAEEKQKVISSTIEYINGRVPLIVGMGSNNTTQLISDIKAQDFKGVDGILSVSPYYNKPTQNGIYEHYKAISQACPVDIILYNVPGRTSSNMSSETTLRLANDFNNIVAIKEASGDMEQCMEIIKHKPSDFQVISGDDLLTMPYISAGMDGVISVIANAYPKTFSNLVRDAINGDYLNARIKQYKLLKMMQLLFADGNPGGVKVILQKLGICENELRLPLIPVNNEIQKALLEENNKL